MSRNFPKLISDHFAAKINFADPNDPLLRQVSPTAEEEHHAKNELDDPTGDLDATLIPGVVQKYKGRILINFSSKCPIHCRFCFRKNLSPQSFPSVEKNPEPMLDFIANNSSIHEVIFSGGDPLMASREALAHSLKRLKHMPHIQRIRVHTRVPVASPELIDTEMLALFQNSDAAMVWVIHTNHPNEIDTTCQRLFQRLSQSSLRLFSQSVLLKGVNDNAKTLQTLFEQLFENFVTPYYLHLLDPAFGTSHFLVSDAEAYAIWQTLHAQLPGYLLPRLVREQPGRMGKIHLCPAPLLETD